MCARVAFMCHHNTFLIYQSMQYASLERWEKVTHISIAFACIVAALFGIAGYATFQALSQGLSSQTIVAINCNHRHLLKMNVKYHLDSNDFNHSRRFIGELLLGR